MGISTAPKPLTQTDIAMAELNYRLEQEKKYAERQTKKYARLAKYSLDEDNQLKYSSRVQKWRSKISHTDEKPNLTGTKYRDTIDVSPKTITNSAINSVDIINFNNLEKVKSLKIKQVCQSVLREAIQHNVGVECSETYSLNTLKRLSKNIGTQNRVSIPYQQEPYVSVHNHPSSYTIGLDDLLNTATKPNEQIMVVVGNNGSVYAFQKDSNFDGLSFGDDIKNEMLKLFGVDKVKDLDGKCTPEEMLNFVNDILSKGDKYGFKYYKSVH